MALDGCPMLMQKLVRVEKRQKASFKSMTCIMSSNPTRVIFILTKLFDQFEKTESHD